MEIKVCGLTQKANIRQIIDTGADYIGLIFYPASRRYLNAEPVTETFLKELKDIPKVGVFVNEDPARVAGYVKRYKLDVVQLHGGESPGYCWPAAIGVPVWKAFQVDETFDFEQLKTYAPYCDRFLFDAAGEGHGGTGRSFDWSLLDDLSVPLPFMLAGGIGPADADKVKAIQHPGFKGIDLNSRFEHAPGLKDADLVKQFIYAVRNR